MAYIEENLKVRGRPLEEDNAAPGPVDPQDELYKVSERWSTNKKTENEGSVTNSLAMLTAIPEVDLGMEYVRTCISNQSRGTGYSTFCIAHGSKISRRQKRPSA